jgi:hypothetical protein
MFFYRVDLAAVFGLAQTQGSEPLLTLCSLGGVDFFQQYELHEPTSEAVRQWVGTATERWRRHGAFSGTTNVQEDVIFASAEVNNAKSPR